MKVKTLYIPNTLPNFNLFGEVIAMPAKRDELNNLIIEIMLGGKYTCKLY